ncbi:MAG: hypothetical protein IPM59_06335 [Chloracidobacterium sp.]|nr:hypothetical protein [Chloracidobacterium sp.]
MNLRKAFLYTLIGSVAVSALIGIGVILLGNFGNLEVRILMTTLTITATSILGLACGAYYETGRGRVLPLAGIVLALAAAIMTFLIIWNVLDENESFIKSAGTILLASVACSHLSLLSLARLDKRFAWSRIAAFVTVWLLSALLAYLIWFEPDANNDLFARTIGVLSILVASVTVVTPVFHKLSAGEPTVADLDAQIEELRSRITELERQKAELDPGDTEDQISSVNS